MMINVRKCVSAGLFFFLLAVIQVYGQPMGQAQLKDEFGNAAGALDVSVFFKEVSGLEGDILLNGAGMVSQIDTVSAYFAAYKKEDPAVLHAGVIASLGITSDDVEETLRFTRSIIAEDIKNGTICRLQDPLFLQTHFRILRWLPVVGENGIGNPGANCTDAPLEGTLRITAYAVFTISGNYRQDEVHTCALYQLPQDETGMTLAEAEKNKHRLSRFKYSRQEVLAGAYAEGGAEPLVWVTRSGLEEALMEGSICVRLPDGKEKFFNVNRNNGIAYDAIGLKPAEQKRYWYFGVAAQPLGYGRDINSQLPIFPEVAFAGDVYNMGLGKLLAIRYRGNASMQQTIRLGVLADAGGIFTPNLQKLDYYAGVFSSRDAFQKILKSLSDYAEVYILVKKSKK